MAINIYIFQKAGEHFITVFSKLILLADWRGVDPSIGLDSFLAIFSKKILLRENCLELKEVDICPYYSREIEYIMLNSL